MNSIVLLGVSSLFMLVHAHSPSQSNYGTTVSHYNDLNMYRHLLNNPRTCSMYDSDESETAKLNQKTNRPKCSAERGCDIPLNCHNYTTSNITLGEAGILQVTPIQLQSILEEPNVTNSCALVMFYAPWCEYSVRFASRFNRVGRMFRELPVMAVDLSIGDP